MRAVAAQNGLGDSPRMALLSLPVLVQIKESKCRVSAWDLSLHTLVEQPPQAAGLVASEDWSSQPGPRLREASVPPSCCCTPSGAQSPALLFNTIFPSQQGTGLVLASLEALSGLTLCLSARSPSPFPYSDSSHWI